MNTVKLYKSDINTKFKIGDLFYYVISGEGANEGKVEYYILSQLVSEVYVAIHLQNGEPWSRSCKDINNAVKGLSFLGRDYNILLEEKKQ